VPHRLILPSQHIITALSIYHYNSNSCLFKFPVPQLYTSRNISLLLYEYLVRTFDLRTLIRWYVVRIRSETQCVIFMKLIL